MLEELGDGISKDEVASCVLIIAFEGRLESSLFDFILKEIITGPTISFVKSEKKLT